MDNIKNILGNYTLLKTIPKEYLMECLKNNTIKTVAFDKGEIIHFDGDVCTDIEILLNGQVAVERIDADGNLMTITDFYPDDILGGNLVFSKNPYYPMTVTAITDVSLISIPKSYIFEFCATNKDFLKMFLEYISDHTLLLGDKIKHYVNRTIRESLIAFLKSQYRIQNSHKILLKCSKKTLADRIGVQRTSISRELQKMKHDGLIEYDTDSITVIDLKLFE